MNLSQLPAYFVCAVLGAVAVKALDHRTDDTVTAKRVVVTDDDGKTVIQLDASGVQVMAEASNSFTRIKAKDVPQIDFVRDGSTVVAVGQNWAGTDGVTLYHGGKIAGAFSTSDDRTIMGVLVPNGDGAAPTNWDDLIAGSKGFASISARADATGLKIGLGSDHKELMLPGANQ